MGDFTITISSWWQVWIVEGLLFKLATPILGVTTIFLTFLQFKKSTHFQDMEERHKNETTRLEHDIEQLKYANLRESGKVNPESDAQLIRGANESVQLLGINSLGILHHTQEDIIEFLRDNDGLLQVLLLDPNSKAFRDRVEFEDDRVERIISEWRSSIRILLTTSRRADGHGEIELRIHTRLPDRSLAIIDGMRKPSKTSKMLINYYPKERGKRGYVGGQFLADYGLTNKDRS